MPPARDRREREASASLWGPFVRLSVVNILSNILVPLAGFVDTAFLGHLADIRYLAGVSLATVLFNYVYWTFGFLRMGTTGLTAQALGRRDQADQYLILVRHGLMAIALGLGLILLQWPIQQVGFAVLGAAPAVEAAGIDYYQALIWGAPCTLLNFVLLGWLLGRAQGRWVLLLSAVNNGSNIVLNYVFIVVWAGGRAGAGAATACSQGLMTLVGLILIGRQFPWQQIGVWRDRLIDGGALGPLLRLQGDILIRTLALISVFACFTNLSAAINTQTLAANALLLQVVTLSAYFVDGLAFATESVVGQLQGQGQLTQLRPLLWGAGWVSSGFGLAIALVFNRWPDRLFPLLTSHTAVVSQVELSVGWLLPVLGLGAWAYILDGYFLGLTQGAKLRRSALIAMGVGFGPGAAIAWQTQNIHWLWLALTSFMAVRVLTLGWQVPTTWRMPAAPSPAEPA